MSRPSMAERVALDSRRVVRVYSILARVYDSAFDWALGPGRRRALHTLPIEAGDRVLEIGVGTGLSLPYYPQGCRLTGVDISEEMLEQAYERAGELGHIDVDLRLMDARTLDFPDSSFDHVLAPYVISVVPEPERVMAEICRVCKPGGTVIVVNHFHSSNRALGLVERSLTPATQWIGFRMDLPVEVVTGSRGLSVDSVERVNMFGLWKLIVMRRPR
jgi:phosphatidylethanolamine/phosphatidyl-N-methylethanolamine N-methyltransferase